MKKATLILVLVSMLTLVLVTVAPAGEVMDRILKKGELVVGTTASQPPMIATSKTGQIIGFDADRVNPSKITGLGVLRGELLNSGPGLDDVDKANLVAFLKALTDERVVLRKAPCDHPQLFVPNGHHGDETSVTSDGTGNATDEFIEIPAVGAAGTSVTLPSFNEKLLP